MTFIAHFARPLLLLIAACALVLAGSGCGEKKEIELEGKEGERINLGGLVYQVQLSRILNPKDVEDEAYTRRQPAPRPSEVYYGVFLRADNEESDKPLMPISDEEMKIVDAGGREFHPLPTDAPGLSWEPSLLAKGQYLPIPDSAGYNYPTRGGLILFKIPYTSLDNRPLIFEMEGKDGVKGEVDLDV